MKAMVTTILFRRLLFFQPRTQVELKLAGSLGEEERDHYAVTLLTP